MRLLLLFILSSIFISCTQNSKDDFTYRIYQDTIIKLQEENDSIKKANKELSSKLYNCDNWVNLLEEDAKD